MKASRQLKTNIDALLHARGQTRKDLAEYCHRSESWLSQIFRERAQLGEQERGIRLVYLDRIADFFGIHAYQLFQPGISPLTERRKGERRRGQERRKLASRALTAPPFDALYSELKALDADDLRQVRRLLTDLRSHVGDRTAQTPDTPAQPVGTGTATRKPQRKQGHG